MLGKQDDIVVTRGKPTRQITDIENVEMIFKDGIGSDTAKLINSVKSQVGQR